MEARGKLHKNASNVTHCVKVLTNQKNVCMSYAIAEKSLQQFEGKHDNECSHNRMRVTHKGVPPCVSSISSQMNCSDKLPLLPTEFISSHSWIKPQDKHNKTLWSYSCECHSKSIRFFAFFISGSSDELPDRLPHHVHLLLTV